METNRLAVNREYWQKFYKVKQGKEVQLSFIISKFGHHQIEILEIIAPKQPENGS